MPEIRTHNFGHLREFTSEAILAAIADTHILLPKPEGWVVKEVGYEGTGEQQGEVCRTGTITRDLTNEEWVEFVGRGIRMISELSELWTGNNNAILSSGVWVVRKESHK